MKNLFALLLLASALFVSGCSGNQSDTASDGETAHEHHEPAAAPAEGEKKPLSPRTSAMANIGSTHVHIDYSSPGVRGRTIWGGLVAYDQVWVTGAHKATAINFNHDVKIGGKTVPAGTYGFFTIPGKEKWILILNKNHEQHLADDYDPALDVVRLTVTPETLPEPVESLTYEVLPTGAKAGVISVSWERIKVSFPVEEG